MTQYIGDKLIKGSIWSIASRFSLRAIGLINTVILARLLAPEDFGLIALSMLAVGFVMLFSSTGMGQAILRREEINDALLNTAWTIRILAGIVLSLCIYFLAPWAALYFEDDRIQPIMQLIALQPFLESLNNIGFVLYAKNLEFHKVFFRTLLSKILAVSASIALAYWLKNYWALAIGMVLQSAITTTMSFVMHPYRPRFCLSETRELASDSINSVSKNMAVYLKQKADDFFVGSLGGAESLGGYYMAKSVTNMLTAELVQPTSNALLPGYSKMVNDPERLKNAVIKVLQTVALVALACGIGLSAIAEHFVIVIFGWQWTHIIPYFKIFALLGSLTALQSVTWPVLMAKGKLNTISYFVWFNLLCFVGLLWFIAKTGDILLIAQSLLLLSSVFLLLNYGLLILHSHIGVSDIIKCFYRPVVASAAMFFGLHYLQSLYSAEISIISLLLNTLFGAYIFITVILLLWFINKRPDGIESIILNRLIKKQSN